MGTTETPAMTAPSGIPGLPGQQIPSAHVKADPSRVVKYGGRQYELKTPEEQQQGAIDQQVKKETALELAKGEQAQRVRQSILQMRGIPVPDDIATALRMPPGSRVLPEEIPGLAEHVATINKPTEVRQGGSLVSPTTGKVLFSSPEKLDDQQQFVKNFIATNGTGDPARDQMNASIAYARRGQDPAVRAQAEAAREEARAFREQSHQDALNNQNLQRGEQSYRFHAGELDKEAKPVADLMSRFGRLEDSLAQNTPQADALVAPELLSVMAGGQGSGIRINEAEIKRVVGGRSKWEDLQAAVNKWRLDPTKANSITPEQRQEIRALASTVKQRLDAKQAALTEARTALSSTNDPLEHRKILSGAKEKLTSIDSHQPAAGVIYARDPAGQLHQAPAGTALPAGWKEEKR